MRISKLIETLEKRLDKHGDREVEVTWESIVVSIEQDSIYLAKEGILLIDADGNFYKEGFAVDPAEGESDGH